MGLSRSPCAAALACGILCTATAEARPTAATLEAYDRPQYLALNFDWDPGVPASFTQQSITQMLAALNGTVGGPTRRLAFSFDFWTLYDANVS